MQGGTLVTITGGGLSKGMRVFFAGNEAFNPYCSDSNSCTIFSPASATPGPVDVRVSIGGILSPLNPVGDRFTYFGPSVSRITPATGPETGGTYVDLYGTSLQDGMIVRFDEVKSAYGATCQDNTRCTTISPPGTGQVRVSVEVNGVRSSKSDGPLFTYARFPTVSGVVPASGPATGATSVTIVGTNFGTAPGATSITFGANSATNVSCTATQCTATTPPGAGTVDVVVAVNTLPSTKNASSRFSYVPVVTSITPNSGPGNGGTSVSITGAGFFADKFGSRPSITFGVDQTTNAICSGPTSCTATSPAGKGTVDVRVTLDGYTSAVTPADKFTYSGGAVSRGWTQWNLQPDLLKPGSSLTYDPVRKQVVYTDLLAATGTNLSCLPASPDCTAPPPAPTYVGETWTWDVDATAWQKQSPAASPALSNSAFAYHDGTARAVLFGGLRHVGFSAVPVNQTWTWDGFNWAMASPPLSPPARYDASMAYDTAHNKIVLFGGCSDHLCTVLLNDMWTWDGATWKKESPPSTPPARSKAAIAYDSASGKIILFGGQTINSRLGDMWTWDGNNWAQLTPQTLPPARSAAGIAYSQADGGLVLFGGLGTAGYFNDTWIWYAGAWTQEHPATSPAAVGTPVGMAYDAARNAVVLVGGDGVWTWGGQ